MSAPSEPLLVKALMRPEFYGAGVTEVRLVETHISWVFLTGRHAYKLKKPVKLPFLDFGTLEKRRRFCELELLLNRRLAPELYLDVVPIGGSPDAPVLGAGPAIEYAVKMREFPADARLDRRLAADDVPRGAVQAFATRIARFHSGLPALTGAAAAASGAAAMTESASENVRELRGLLEGKALDTLEPVAEWSGRQCATLAPVLEQRLATGAHKEGHGDLHLENLVMLDGAVHAFDALEFDARLRRADVISEAAFPAMDFMAHARSDLAYVFLNGYLEATGDYDGLRVLRFYLVHRALVRAKVRAIAAAQAGAPHSSRGGPAAYLALARRLVEERRPLLTITHGLSGSGKTHATSELVGLVPALRVRSDLERKRLHGIRPSERSDSPVAGALYSGDSNERTYGVLADAARNALHYGFDVIVDAAFLSRARRDGFRKLAAAEDSRFAALDCRAADAVLRGRIEARAEAGRDASEATPQVLDYQLAHCEPLGDDERADSIEIDTALPIDYDRLAERLRAL